MLDCHPSESSDEIHFKVHGRRLPVKQSRIKNGAESFNLSEPELNTKYPFRRKVSRIDGRVAYNLGLRIADCGFKAFYLFKIELAKRFHHSSFQCSFTQDLKRIALPERGRVSIGRQSYFNRPAPGCPPKGAAHISTSVSQRLSVILMTHHRLSF